MNRRTVRRGVAALAFAALLGLAGAHPAAAEEIELFERSLRWLSGLWGAQGAAEQASPWEGLLSIWGEETDKGPGMDPNGGTVQSVVTPPREDG